MTEQQYKRAVEINNRLKDLSETMDSIRETSKHRLWYAYNSGNFGSEWRLGPEWAMRNISEILDRHDLMIRQEIQAEMERLKSEISSL